LSFSGVTKPVAKPSARLMSCSVLRYWRRATSLAFCRMSQLPTESEREFAARGGLDGAEYV
jgi:hypothetical protein